MTAKKSRKASILLTVTICSIYTGLLSILIFQEYRQTLYQHISGLCQLLAEAFPGREETVISSLMKYRAMTEQEIEDIDFLNQYGYTASFFSVDIEVKVLGIAMIVLLLSVLLFSLLLFFLRKWNRARIQELTNYLELINTGKTGTMLQREEDDFSQLQDEIYKTVTRLTHTKETALKARESYADNIANIAHQLKTPITSAGISLQLIKEENSSIYINQIQKHLDRLTRLEESLLTLSQIDAGVLKLERLPVDLYTALTLASDNLYDISIQNNVTVHIPEKGRVEIIGDLEWTMQAFMNLMKNCMEHSREGGSIHCDYDHNPLYQQVLIWDDGEGFAEEDFSHLFQRFYRGKRAVGSGIGIGLSLASAIMEMQNGIITAYNLPEGGACFDIRIYSH